MFYETKNSLSADTFKIERGTDFSFPAHIHGSFELITVIDGETIVEVEQTEYLLKKGSVVLVFPNQVHKLKCHSSCSHFLCIFSPKLISAYSKKYLSKIPKSNLFEISAPILDLFLSLSAEDSVFKVKGILYTMCDEFEKSASYCEQKKAKDTLLPTILKFVEANYSTDCTLKSLSKETAYNYEYLSKYFKERTGISFTDYVNRFRINEACYLLQNSDQSMLQTALECGFDSLRSFNRNFKKIISVTPSQYKINYIS